MSFKASLEEICTRTDGAVAATIMGYDGIAIETHEAAGGGGGVDINSSLVEYSNIFGQIRLAAQNLQAGTATEFWVRTQQLAAHGRVVSDEHFVLLATKPDANHGKARYMLRIGAAKVAAEL